VSRTSESRRTAAAPVVVAFVLVALAAFAVGSGSRPANTASTERRSGHPTRTLDGLRTVAFVELHQPVHVDRIRSNLPLWSGRRRRAPPVATPA